MVNQLDFSQAGQGYMLRPIQQYLQDPAVSEILINKPQEVYIEKHGELNRIVVPELDKAYLHEFFKIVAIWNHQSISKTKPLFYGSLQDGSRITLVVPPTSGDYTLSIRRKVVSDLDLENYRKQNHFKATKPLSNLDNDEDLLDTDDYELINLYQDLISKYNKISAEKYNTLVCQFIIKAVQYKKTIVLSGGTSSGKTTFLNACIKAMGADERIILLEDTREIDITKQHNFVSLLAKSSTGSLEESPIKMTDLVKACLRLRPDRIIMGEIRSAEMFDFVRAANTGYDGSITTVHADNPKMAFQAMASMYKQAPNIVMNDNDIIKKLHDTIDIVIQLNKHGKGLRQASMIYYKHANIRI